MKTIEHEGQTFVLKADIENAFKDRIQKLSARAIQAEEAAKTIQEQYDNQSGELEKIQKLSTRVQELEGELENANNRYSRHTAMADLGIVDAEVRELVEWQYEKATKGDAKAPALNEWLAAMKADPSSAPVTLRPHLQTETAAAPAEQVTEQVTEQAPVTEEQPALIAPKTNTGTTPAPMQSTNLLNRGADDFEFYKANRDAIRKAWPGRGGR
jgi:DNA repair exonuclease SbcCD ATPase subunit